MKTYKIYFFLLLLLQLGNLRAQAPLLSAYGVIFQPSLPKLPKIGNYDRYDSLKLSYTFGVEAYIRINKTFQFETGLTYSSLNFQSKIYHIDPTKWFGEFNSYVPKLSQETGFIHSIIIPTKVSHINFNRKISVFYSIGLLTGVMVDQKQEYIEEDYGGRKTYNKQYEPYRFKKLTVSLTSSLGVSVKLSEQYFLVFGPKFSVCLNGLVINSNAVLQDFGVTLALIKKR